MSRNDAQETAIRPKLNQKAEFKALETAALNYRVTGEPERLPRINADERGSGKDKKQTYHGDAETRRKSG
jgi:hypothetical protein